MSAEAALLVDRPSPGVVVLTLNRPAKRNALSKALMKDPHIAPFIGVPAKENGFDIEGIAVAGDLVAVGLVSAQEAEALAAADRDAM